MLGVLGSKVLVLGPIGNTVWPCCEAVVFEAKGTSDDVRFDAQDKQVSFVSSYLIQIEAWIFLCEASTERKVSIIGTVLGEADSTVV